MTALHQEVAFAHDDMVEDVARAFRNNSRSFRTLDAHALANGLTERIRLARELHDGLLQALTAMALQLDAVGELMEQSPAAAREILVELQEMVVEHQLELRTWIEKARKGPPRGALERTDAQGPLEKICRRAGRFGPHIDLHMTGCHRMPETMLLDVCRLVEEGLSNIRRHARARKARVDVAVARQAVHVLIEDDGSGFAFHGRYNLATLDSRRLGPVSIKERVTSMHGTLDLHSSLSGSCLKMVLPIVRENHPL